MFLPSRGIRQSCVSPRSKRNIMLKKIALGVVAIVFAGIVYIYASYGSIARNGSGYAAKNICSGYFLSGFSPETMKREALAGASSALENISYTIDEEARTVTTTLSCSSAALFIRLELAAPCFPQASRKSTLQSNPCQFWMFPISCHGRKAALRRRARKASTRSWTRHLPKSIPTRRATPKPSLSSIMESS